MSEIITKCCTKCGVEKPLEAFANNKLGKHGKHARCRACFKQEDAEKYARQAEGVTYREGCFSPPSCSSKSHKLCKECTQKNAWLNVWARTLTTGLKGCGKCGKEKPLSAFPNDASRALGVGPTCKECGAEYMRNRRNNDPEFARKSRENNKEYYKLDTEFKAKKYEKKRHRYATDEEYRLAIVDKARNYRLLRRENEEFEAFMARMEREEAEYETTNPTTTEGE